LNIGLPILVGSAGSVVSEYLKRKIFSDNNKQALTKADLVELVRLWKETSPPAKPDTKAAVAQIAMKLVARSRCAAVSAPWYPLCQFAFGRGTGTLPAN